MRHILVRSFVVAAVLVAPAAVASGIALPPIMESWSHSKRVIRAMLAGSAPYDETQIRLELKGYVLTSHLLAGEISGRTAEARGLKARFQGFANDSQSALGEASRPSAVAERFNRMLADCDFCHSMYNN